MTIDQRLGRLERENRWMRGIGAVGVAVAAAVLLMGQGKQTEGWHLVAKSLTINDADGTPRIRLGQERGPPQLVFLDATGRPYITLGQTSSGPLLRFRDKKMVRVVLSTTPDGAASLLFTDPKGKSRCGLGVDPDGSPSVEIRDQDGDVRAALGESATVDKVTGKLIKTAESALTLFDTEGNILWRAP